MIVILGAVIGALIGGFTAKKRNGNTADIAQYATGFAIAFALAGMVLTILLEKLLA
ncbi:hypothetical protein TRP8649_02637 [Pelagimonas phthalicica]|uniref:Apolipoprotein acyltransferase n=1 Tax=Pelagimonas phthalicica TaxID=1037362 RepID=A0A238JE82_9RHOB|nr:MULTISPECIES: apolipoprotein acyltransferase [Roseobacteraceae]MBO9464494.1 apolipoprotein acyltransferase [Tropicibacter sp. R15_0]TDS91465.1 hypothetical protein CLV87_2638 [Pelagimonas phthalicica]SMX28514.1 hypothetical protein TRP8649_02637 [Pelagimonas phthalicica]